jgi:hypothetical protein
MSQPHSPSDRVRYRPVAIALILGGLAFAGCVAYHQTATQKEPSSAELELCRRFMALKNGRDAAANGLLGPEPVVPAAAVSPEEADQLHAEFFLHGEYQVVSVQPETADASGPDAQFVLALKGGVTSPRIPQVGPNGTDIINRSLTDPDIIVRVEGGTIRAVLWRLHHDPHEKQPSAEEQRQFREAMEEQQREQLRQLQGPGRRGGK